MKKTALLSIRFYQIFISPLLSQVLGIKNICRNSYSCSHFAYDAVKKRGVIKGGFLALKRIVSCRQPLFYKI